MTLDSLVKPLHEMSEAEIFEHIRQVRHSRRTPTLKKPSKKVVEKKKTKDLVGSLSPEQLAQLLKQLEG